jgi:hypothetical protein
LHFTLFSYLMALRVPADQLTLRYVVMMKSQSSSSPTDKHYNNDATADSTTMETLKGWPV